VFDALGDKLAGVFDNLTGRGALSEKDVSAAMREIRVALLEADVALPVVKDFIAKIKAESVGEKVIKSIKPGQQVVKIVHDGLVEMLGGSLTDEELMAEVEEIAKIAKPVETLLVADALTGQDAVQTAQRFHAQLPLTGLVLTRIDGDGRGGAALSMRAVLSPLLSAPQKSLTKKKRNAPPSVWKKVSSIWTTLASSLARCKKWAAWAA